MLSGLAKIGITNTQKKFPMIPKSEVIVSITEPEICTKMLRNLSELLGAKFPPTTLGYSMVKVPCLDDACSEILELKPSPEGQQLQQRDKKWRTG